MRASTERRSPEGEASGMGEEWRFPGPAKHMMSGVGSGCLGTMAGHPLDTIKARLQTQKAYRGMVDCFAKILRTEGVAGLYKGMAPPLSQLSVMCMLNFMIFAQGKEALQEVEFIREHRALQSIAAGAMTGVTGAVVGAPFEFIKIQMQLDNVNLQRFTGSLDCVRSVTRAHGIRTLWTGAHLSFARDTCFGAVYFGTYDTLKRVLNERLVHRPIAGTLYSLEENSVPIIVLAGGFAGMSAWFSCFPFDSVKTRIQGVPLPIEPPLPPDMPARTTSVPKRAVAVTLEKIWSQQGGVRGFFNGVIPCLTRAFFVHAIRFNIYEAALKGLTKFEGWVNRRDFGRRVAAPA